MTLDKQSLDEMARNPASPDVKTGGRGKSLRATVAANLDKIDAARANGWPLANIAAALGFECNNPGSQLSSYLASIKRSNQKRAAKRGLAVPTPQPAPEQPKFIPGQLPPPPGAGASGAYETPEFTAMRLRAEEKSAALLAEKLARQSEPKAE
ncbi:MAG TPA: hypothetical protein PK677_17515 [Acidiphilium sp.]|uniref:hypothetical protein n=1 Tax=Acidiphilium sp. 37-64-53 TaxID=1970299 RepID=UPI00257CD076|nr:hypothetical protein [Acidiphilium sp. 37-64-53]HQT90302.1 hypothetical protein [Acidiphilium sp.]